VSLKPVSKTRVGYNLTLSREAAVAVLMRSLVSRRKLYSNNLIVLDIWDTLSGNKHLEDDIIFFYLCWLLGTSVQNIAILRTIVQTSLPKNVR